MVSIRVVARFRPLINEKELAMNMSSSYEFIGDEMMNINVSIITSFPSLKTPLLPRGPHPPLPTAHFSPPGLPTPTRPYLPP